MTDQNMTGSAVFFTTLFGFPSVVSICIVYGSLAVLSSTGKAYFACIFALFFAKSYYLMNSSNSSSTDGTAFSFSAAAVAAKATAATYSSYSFYYWSFFYFAVSRFLAGYLVFFAPAFWGTGGSWTVITGAVIVAGFSASTSLHKSSYSENMVFFFFFGYCIVIIYSFGYY